MVACGNMGRDIRAIIDNGLLSGLGRPKEPLANHSASLLQNLRFCNRTWILPFCMDGLMNSTFPHGAGAEIWISSFVLNPWDFEGHATEVCLSECPPFLSRRGGHNL